MTTEDPQAELLRRFQAAIAGAELADLRDLVGHLTRLDPHALMRPGRPELRRPPLDALHVLRVRADLVGAHPPIWRRVLVRGDATLDVVHQVLQAAFGWTDSHLHRFSLGGNPFDPTSQVFLCPFDVFEQEAADDGGIPAADVRLDETLQQPGDVLEYVYDYGDNWQLTLRLEEIAPVLPSARLAECLDGRRAAPPEDCGGIVDAAQLAEVLDDPAHFDVDEVNVALLGPYGVLGEYGIDERLVDLVNRLAHTDSGDDLVARSLALTGPAPELAPERVAASLRAFQWFLDRAVGGGIALTAAGYLKPDDVEAASAVVPSMGDWPDRPRREVNAGPLLTFRKSLQTMGLLRKYKGALLLTRIGARAQRDPQVLWDVLVDRLRKQEPDEFTDQATRLLLAHAASSSGATLSLRDVTRALGEVGWRHQDGRPLAYYELYAVPALGLLRNVSDVPERSVGGVTVNPVAAAMARAALLRPPTAG